MRPDRLAVVVIWTTLVGLLVAVGLARGEQVSVQIWLIATALAMGATAMVQLTVAASVEPSRIVVAWRSSLVRRRGLPNSVRGLVSTETVLLDATGNARAHVSRLRPRLSALAGHYLPIRHGIDLDHEPERVTELLGDVAWLIDPAVSDRAPTPAEIDRFLDLILTDHAPATTP